MAEIGGKEVPAAMKKSVRAVLLSKDDGVLLSKFPRDYRSLLEEPVPYIAHGFTSVEDFLRAMPDVARFEYSNVNNDWRLYGIGDPNSYMSGHAKKAQGNPGQDVDKLDMPRKRHRKRQKSHHGSGGGRGVRSCRDGVQQGRQSAEEGAEEMLLAGHNGLYSLCCPVMKNKTEDILKDFERVAEVVETSLSKSYLFTRYRTKDEALRIINTFKTQYLVRPAMGKLRQRRDPTQQSFVRNCNTERAKAPSQEKGSIEYGVEIYIGNIPKTLTEANILYLLEGLPVRDVRIKVKDMDKRFAFGTLSREDASVAVKKLDQMPAGGRRLICRLANPDPKKAGPGQKVPKTNPETVAVLVKMGFSQEGARRAVYYSGDQGVEEAVTWIAEHLDDPDLNQPFTIPRSGGEVHPGGEGTLEFRPSSKGLHMLMAQGVSRERAVMALKASNNRVVAAESWLFQHSEELTTTNPVEERSNERETCGMPQASLGHGGLSTSVPSQPSQFCPDQKALSTLLTLGLPRDKVLRALEATNNDLEQASEWIIRNTDELQAAMEKLHMVNATTATVTDTQENSVETEFSESDTELPSQPNPTALPPVTPITVDEICENSRHDVPKENGDLLTPSPDHHGNKEDSKDDMPSLEDEDEEIPELEYDTEDEEGSVEDLSNDSNSVSTESDTQRVSIFVGNFPYGTTQVELLEIFSDYQPRKITMINNRDQCRNTYAFLVLPTMELAEAAIEEMSGEEFMGRRLLVGMAYIDRGYNEPPEEPEPEETDDESDESTSGLPDSVQLFDSLMKTLWPDCRLLTHGIYGKLEVYVTSVVNDHFFYGHITSFGREMFFLSALNEELNQVCRRRLPEKKTPMHRCAALFEDNWYRAYNMGQFGQGQLQAVLFVDYGNIESLPAKELRRPDARFWEDPAVAKLFQLVVGSLADYPNIEGSTIKIATIPKNDGEEMNSITNVKIIESP